MAYKVAVLTLDTSYNQVPVYLRMLRRIGCEVTVVLDANFAAHDWAGAGYDIFIAFRTNISAGDIEAEISPLGLPCLLNLSGGVATGKTDDTISGLGLCDTTRMQNSSTGGAGSGNGWNIVDNDHPIFQGVALGVETNLTTYNESFNSFYGSMEGAVLGTVLAQCPKDGLPSFTAVEAGTARLTSGVTWARMVGVAWTRQPYTNSNAYVWDHRAEGATIRAMAWLMGEIENVELDVSGQPHNLDFSDDTVGSPPPGWFQTSGTGNLIVRANRAGNGQGYKAAHFESSSGYWVYDNGLPESSSYDVTFRARSTTTGHAHIRLYLRDGLYWIEFDRNTSTNELEVRLMRDGSIFSINIVEYPGWDEGRLWLWYRVQFADEGGTSVARVKVWQGHLADEPVDWDGSGSNSDHTGKTGRLRLGVTASGYELDTFFTQDINATDFPAKPTITADADGLIALLEGSAYSHPGGLDHTASRWQADTDSTFPSPDYDETDVYPDDGAPALPGHEAGVFDPSTLYYFRVQYRDSAGHWGEFSDPVSATTDAGNPPNTPSVSAVAGSDMVELTGSALSDVEDPARTHVMSEWQVDLAAGDYSSPVAQSLEDLANLTFIILGGLSATTNYKARYRQRVADGNWTAWSADETFTTATPPDPPSTPTASVQSKTATSITLQGTAFAYPTEPGETHASTLVQVSTSSTFASAVHQRLFTPGQVTGLEVDGLTRLTLYYYRIRYRGSNGVWSAWSSTLSTTTLDSVFSSGTFLRPTFPRHGEVIRGDSYPIAWTPGSETDVSFALEVAPAGGDVENLSWSSIESAAAASPYALDTTQLEDGVYTIRMRAEGGGETTPWEYRTIVVDNAGNPLIYNPSYENEQPEEDFTPLWNTEGHTWTMNGRTAVNQGSNTASSGWAALAYDPPRDPIDVDIMAEVLNASTGGSFPWSWFPEQAWAGVGVSALNHDGRGSDAGLGIFAAFYAIPIQSYGDCFHSGRGDGFLNVYVKDDPNLPDELALSVTIPLGKIHFTKLWDGCNKIPFYGVRLRVTTEAELSPTRRRIRIQAAVQGMGIDTDDTGPWHYDDTFEADLHCGRACYVGREITTSRAYRLFTSLTVMPTAYGTCETPPEWPEEPVAPGAPCTLILQVFEEDDETIAWEVGTAQDHENPYLILPENYAAQEVDFINGAATIGQVEVGVIDRRQTLGDQDSGWMTERLIFEGVPAIRNRRCRLLRYISVELGWVVIVDGPADAPRLHDSYAGYRWVVKDQRENERKIRAFEDASNWSVFPPGLAEEVGWGLLPDGSYMVPALDGPATANVAHSSFPTVDGSTRLTFNSLNPGDVVLTQPMKDAAEFLHNGLFWEPGQGYGVAGTFPRVAIRWRYVGDTDEQWRIVREPAWVGSNLQGLQPKAPALLLTGTGEVAQDVGGVVNRVNWGPREGEEVPTNGATVEFNVMYIAQASEQFPRLIDGLTTGQLLKNGYDGLYSPLDPVTGEIRPTGIRYNEEALLLMTDPVRLRLTEPVEDFRAWSEAKIYAPTGWSPTMDRDLYISPSSQVPPDSFDGVPEVNNINAHPEPNWDAGEFTINFLEFNYPRYYVVEEDEDVVSVDRLAYRSVTVVYRSASSVGRAVQKASFDGVAFAALGNPPDGVLLEPEEQAAALANDRRLYIFDRYNHGAQGIQVPVRRVDSALWKTGDWVVVNLSWIPDYLTQRRGGLWGGQIMMIADLNCAWRVVLVEEAAPLIRPDES